MSKTDKTQPYNVKALFYPSWTRDLHDHRNGVCDLPPHPTHDNIGYSSGWNGDQSTDGKCRWAHTRDFMNDGMFRHSCSLCGWDAFDVPLRRRQRYDAKRYCRDGWRNEY